MDRMYFSYRDQTRLVIDDFTDGNLYANSLGGTVTANNFSEVAECGNTSCFPGINQMPAQCGGKILPEQYVMRLGWLSDAVYETQIPTPYRDVRGYSTLSFRAGQSVSFYPPLVSGPPLVLSVNLEDVNGRRAALDISSANYGALPYPPDNIYKIAGSESCTSDVVNFTAMNTIRIPLEDFRSIGTGLDLANITKVVIKTSGQGLIGMDDLEFSK